MNKCRVCHQPCGEREFCDETCHKEYEEGMKAFAEWDNTQDDWIDYCSCGNCAQSRR